MEPDRLLVGQMAAINNISQQTLRLYDRMGLLRPHIVDSQNGYRYYHINQSARLDMIQYMKACGMTLKEIKSQLDSRDRDLIKGLLKKRYDAIGRDMAELRRNRAAIARTLENYRRYETLPRGGEVFMEYIPQRKIYKHVSGWNFFDQDYTGYEFMLRDLKQNLTDQNLPAIYFCNVGTIIRKEKLLARELFSNEVFVFLDNSYAGPGEIEIIPGGTYIALCSDDFYKEAENVTHLLRHIARRKLEIAGDYICEVITEFPVFENNRPEMFYKVQIPVVF